MRTSSIRAFRAAAAAIVFAAGIIYTLVTISAPAKDQPEIILAGFVGLGLAAFIAVIVYSAARR